MSATGLDVFDRTLHKTNLWLNDVMQELGADNRHQAYRALRATLHALRDRLTIDEVADLGAQLPMLIRGFYYVGWDPSGKPLRERHREQFLARIAEVFKGDEGGRSAHPAGRDSESVAVRSGRSGLPPGRRDIY